MKVKEFTVQSSNQTTTLFGTIYLPNQDPTVIVQLCHGMCEYIDRYEPMARILTDNNIALCGVDHLGHGRTAERTQGELGYFGDNSTWENLVEDQEITRKLIKKEFPNTPYYLLGHSMGSFIARCYLAKYGDLLSGAMISGTAGKNPILPIGKMIVKCVIGLEGKHKRSKLLWTLCTGNYNKGLGDKTGVEWLCHDANVCGKYKKDPWCNYVFTAEGYKILLDLLEECNKEECIKNTPNDLRIWFYAGSADPVGNHSKGVLEVYNRFIENGKTQTTIKLFKEDRHEVHHEADKEELFQNIIDYVKV